MLRLYQIPYSTNVERVALALGHKGVAAESVGVDPADRSPLRRAERTGARARAGRRRRRRQRLGPHHAPPRAALSGSAAVPSDRAERARVELFLDWFNRAWKREPNLITDALEGGRTEGDDIERWGARMQSRLELFEALLSGREYLFGAFGAADCAAWPFLRYAVTPVEPDDVEVFHEVLYERMTLDERHPGVRAWIARVGERPRA